MTLLPSRRLARYVVFLRRFSAPAPTMMGMCGFSSLGNSLFLNANFEPHADQWSFLSTLRRMTSAEVTAIAEEAGRQGKVVGLRLPFDEEDEEPWAAPPSRRRPELPIAGPLPKTIDAVLADQIYIPRAGLPAALTNRLIRIAAFQNPAFYSAQANATFDLRDSTCRRVRRSALPSHRFATRLSGAHARVAGWLECGRALAQ
jgi:hypothetical protein